MLRITYGRAPTEKLSEAATAALLRAARSAGAVEEGARSAGAGEEGAGEEGAGEGGATALDVAELHATLATLAVQVRAVFARHVGESEA